MSATPTKAKPLLFARVDHAYFHYWTSRNGRWYWHRIVNGEVTESGSYAHRRSVRRKLHQVVRQERARRRRGY